MAFIIDNKTLLQLITFYLYFQVEKISYSFILSMFMKDLSSSISHKKNFMTPGF